MRSKNLTQGPIFKTLFIYSLPIIITNAVQLLFHAADVAVLSFMVDDSAVAAVGACGSIITLLVSLFTGFATGTNVLVAKRTGAGSTEGVRRATGTSVLIGLIAGLILMIFALIFSRKLLILTNCQPDVLDMATTYMNIYFLGMPISMLYNFVSAALRATGDSVRPMVYIMVSGVLNVILNVVLIAGLGLTVEGVAIATVISNAVALTLALITMSKKTSICKIEKKHLRIRKTELSEIVKIGIPTCLCSIFFYAANVILSAKVNSIGTDAMTANAISGQFDGFIYTVGCAIAIATSAMIGQNFGARDLDRIKATMKTSVIYVTAVSLSLGALFVLIARPLLSIMTDNETVIEIAKSRMTLLCLTYFITSIMEVYSFSLRALRRQKTTMVVGAICGFGMRTLWAYLIWPLQKTLPMLFACYAVSAAVAIAIYVTVYVGALKEFKSEFSTPSIS